MKQKLISLITAITMMMSLFGAMPITASAYSGGTGTESDPYIIQNLDDLK